MEMLVDPTGVRFVTGDAPSAESDRVEFLVEVCDPCQGADNAYTVNGVLVSDFYTPAYFEPLFTSGSRYSFCGKLRSPRDVLPGIGCRRTNPGRAVMRMLDTITASRAPCRAASLVHGR